MSRKSFVIISRTTLEPRPTETSSQRWPALTSSSRLPNTPYPSCSHSTSEAGVTVLEGQCQLFEK